jgi:UPF0755 protein
VKRAVILSAALVGCGQGSGPLQQVTIPEGATLRTATDTLHTRGILRSPSFFRWYARLLGKADDIKAGVYQLREGMSAPRVLDVLVAGRPALRRLVIPEGLMLGEVATAVSQQLGVPAADLRAAAQDSRLLRQVASPGPTLDGYLYPTTYMVRHGATAAELVAHMVAEFEGHWRPEWDARLDTLKMTRHQVVTLASIVEGEVRFPPDRRYVSSVYHNRLRRGMRLQADPTVIYALGRRRRLFEKDYLLRSPYNTYLINGLPPGPIGQPSQASMAAALYPAQSSFLYLVAQADGKHVFSRTYREHLEAVRTVRRRSGAPASPASRQPRRKSRRLPQRRPPPPA